MAGETVVVEPLNGGLVTARDPSLLRRGELQQAQDTIYKPNDQAIWRAPGRVKYNSTAQGGGTPVDIKGMRFLLFDDADNVLVVHHGTSYGYSVFDNETETGSPPFTTLFDEVGSGPTLDSVHYNNKHTLLNGVAATSGSDEQGQNHVLKSDKVMRRHGLDPVVSTPGLALVAGSWPNDEGLPINKWYFFIYTEVHAANTTDEVESTWGSVDPTGKVTSVPGAIYVNSAAVGVQVTRQAIINDGAESDGTQLVNKWRVYMSTPQEGTSGVRPPDPPLSAYALVAEVDVGVLGGTETTTVVVSNQSASVGFQIAGTGVNIAGAGVDWGSPSAVNSDNNVGATASVSSPGGASDWLAARNFGLGAIAGTITGIEVEVKLRRITSLGSSSTSTSLQVGLSKDNGVNQNGTAVAVIDGLPLNEWVVRRVGAATDLWNGTWVAGDFADGLFSVRCRMVSTVGGIEIDYVKAKVSAGGQGLAYGVPFPAVVVEVAGIAFVVGSNGPPPIATTGDVFESQMVLNDVADQSRILYSLPDRPEYFPWVYFLNFETKEQDIVTCIRRLGNKLIVGHRNSIFRVNYLPRETDSEFDRGRCYEAITERHGIVGTQAAALFTPPEKPMMLAYVSAEGVHATDGFQTTTLTEDLDWKNTMALASLDNCILVDYPKYSALVLYYTPPSGSANTRALWLSYHPSHVKEGGKLLVSGPNIMGSGSSGTSSSHLGRLNNGWALMTGRPDGFVYVEDRGVNDGAGIGINPTIITRDIYPVGIGYEATVERTWVRKYASTSPTMTVTVTPYKRNTESAPAAQTAKTFTTALLGLSRLEHHFIGESYYFQLTSPDAQGGAGNNEIGISYIALEVAAHGLEETKQTSA